MEIVRKKMEEVHFSQSAIKKMAIDREYKGMTDKINNDVNRQVFDLIFLFWGGGGNTIKRNISNYFVGEKQGLHSGRTA